MKTKPRWSTGSENRVRANNIGILISYILLIACEVMCRGMSHHLLFCILRSLYPSSRGTVLRGSTI